MNSSKAMENAIKGALRSVTAQCCATPGMSTSQWTTSFVKSMVQLGHFLSYKVCASGEGADWKEWLYDVVWYVPRGTGDNERLDDVPMVMECEWAPGTKEISLDFEKLLVANSPMKVFVFSPSTLSREEWLSYFNDSIANYKRRISGETYLIGFVREAMNDILFETIVVP